VLHALGLVALIGWKVLDRIHFGSSFALSPHGLGIAVGYLAGSYVFVFEGRRRGISEDHSGSLVLWALVGAIVGARFFWVLAHYNELASPADAFAVWRGGISLIGGIFGAIAFSYPVLRRHHIKFLTAMDPAVIGIGLGIVIGRIGDLIIGDHLGKPSSWLLAFGYHGGNLSGYDCITTPGVCVTTLYGGATQTITAGGARLISASGVITDGLGVHQTALYDYISTMALVSVLLWLALRSRRTGMLAVTFGLWYGSVRIVTDFLRVDKRFFGMTGSQWASVAVVAICLATLVVWARRPLPAGTGVLAVPPDEGEEPLEDEVLDADDEDDEPPDGGQAATLEDEADPTAPEAADGEPVEGEPGGANQPDSAPTA